MTKLILIPIIFVISACDALKNDPFKVTTTTIAGVINESPEVAAGIETCNQDWKASVEALRSLADRQNGPFFKVFAYAIPKERSPRHSCKNESEVREALDLQLDMLQKWAQSDFEFMVMIARVQYIADAGLLETLCESGKSILQKNPRVFLKAMTQERANIKNIGCFIKSENIKENSEIDAILKQIKDQDLLAARDELLELNQKK